MRQELKITDQVYNQKKNQEDPGEAHDQFLADRGGKHIDDPLHNSRKKG